MNPARVRERGIGFDHACAARLNGFKLAFDKTSRRHQGVGHANVVFAPDCQVEGVLYWLTAMDEITKMDRFESTPVNYSREIVWVDVARNTLPSELELDRPRSQTATVPVTTWTYFANPAVRQSGLIPPRSYLNHLLEGRLYLSTEYQQTLERWPCDELK
jgi:hypothetical protein